MWQQIFSTSPSAFGFGNVWWLTYPLWIVPVILAGVISYYALERPFLGLRRRFHS